MTITATTGRLSAEITRLSALGAQVSRTQIEVSTSKRIQVASDDPVAAARVATIRRAQADGVTWAANRQLGTTAAAQADGVLTTLADRVARARELVVAGSSDSLSAADRATLATELRGIAEEIDGFAGTTNARGEPLFAERALEMRFDADTRFAPVATRAAIFELGGVALAQQISDAADALALNDAVATRASLDTLEAAIAHVASVAADQGLRAARIDRIGEVAAETRIDLAAERSVLEDTDLSEAIARLNAQTLTLEAAQSAFARINRRTLFDILG